MGLFEKHLRPVPTEAEFKDINKASEGIQQASNNEEEEKSRQKLKAVGRDYRKL